MKRTSIYDFLKSHDFWLLMIFWGSDSGFLNAVLSANIHKAMTPYDEEQMYQDETNPQDSVLGANTGHKGEEVQLGSPVCRTVKRRVFSLGE